MTLADPRPAPWTPLTVGIWTFILMPAGGLLYALSLSRIGRSRRGWIAFAALATFFVGPVVVAHEGYVVPLNLISALNVGAAVVVYRDSLRRQQEWARTAPGAVPAPWHTALPWTVPLSIVAYAAAALALAR